MRRILILLATLALALAAWAAPDQPAAVKPPRTVRLLTVGNSFSQNASRFLGNLATAAGHKLIHHQAVIGGGTMAQHWEKITRLAQDPTDARGRYATKKTLQEELTAEPWDFVTIQQASIRSHDVASYRPYAAQLQGFIKQFAPHATLLVHQTWEYRVDDPRFAVKTPKPGEPATQDAMYQGLTTAYETIAKELGVGLLPVGDAFHLADHDPQWGFRPDTVFNPRTAIEPALPDQTHSLHVGWRWAKGQDGRSSLQYDGHHANVAGQYLGGCVFLAVLFDQSPVGNTFVPPGLTAEDARFLQETAARAVAQRAAR